MNNEIMFFIGVILGGLIVLFEIVKLIKIDRIEKKYVKSVKIVCLETKVNDRIRQFEARGWITGSIVRDLEKPDLVEITFIK